MNPLLWLLIGGSFLTAGDVVFKFWIEKSSSYVYVFGLLLYIAGLCCLVQSYKSTNIAAASAVLVLVNITTLSVVSWIFFKEPLSALQIAGIITAFAAILLLELGGK